MSSTTSRASCHQRVTCQAVPAVVRSSPCTLRRREQGRAPVRVGAGAVVVRDLPANVVAVGNPARVVRHI